MAEKLADLQGMHLVYANSCQYAGWSSRKLPRAGAFQLTDFGCAVAEDDGLGGLNLEKKKKKKKKPALADPVSFSMRASYRCTSSGGRENSAGTSHPRAVGLQRLLAVHRTDTCLNARHHHS